MEELKRKLLELEMNPPAMVWEKITAALDEDADLPQVPQLQELELKPPSKVWDNIITTLDADVPVLYPSTLYNLELQPPADSWKNIATALNEESPVRRIGVFRRYPVFRYAAAAILIGLISFGIKWLTAEPAAADLGVQNIPTQNKNPQNTQPDNGSVQPPVTPDTPKLSNNLPEEGPRQIASINSNDKSYSKPSGKKMASLFESASKESFITDVCQLACLNIDVPPAQDGFADVANRYVVFENSDGNVMRISRKLAEALGCNISDKNSEEYQRCIEQLKKWRDRIANSLLTPAPDNFMDIFQLLKADENHF